MEKVKLQHKTHWDMDYLSNEEVEALYGLNSVKPPEASHYEPQQSRHGKRAIIIGGVAVAILAALIVAWYVLS